MANVHQTLDATNRNAGAASRDPADSRPPKPKAVPHPSPEERAARGKAAAGRGAALGARPLGAGLRSA